MKTTKTGDNFVIIHFIRCMYLDIHIKSVVCSLSHCQQMNKHSTTKREINRESERKIKWKKKKWKTHWHTQMLGDKDYKNCNCEPKCTRSEQAIEREWKKWQHTSIDVFAPTELFRLEFVLCFGLSNVQHQMLGCYLHFSNVQLTPVEKSFLIVMDSLRNLIGKIDWARCSLFLHLIVPIVA